MNAMIYLLFTLFLCHGQFGDRLRLHTDVEANNVDMTSDRRQGIWAPEETCALIFSSCNIDQSSLDADEGRILNFAPRSETDLIPALYRIGPAERWMPICGGTYSRFPRFPSRLLSRYWMLKRFLTKFRNNRFQDSFEKARVRQQQRLYATCAFSRFECIEATCGSWHGMSGNEQGYTWLYHHYVIAWDTCIRFWRSWKCSKFKAQIVMISQAPRRLRWLRLGSHRWQGLFFI